MAGGFRGMINDFMEIFHCISRFPCFSVPNRSDYDYSSILPVPLPKTGVPDLLETDTEDREAVVKEDDPGCPFVDTASADGGTDSTFPRGEQIDDAEGLDLSFSLFRERLCSTSEGEEDSLNTKLIKDDSEFVPSLQVAGEKTARHRKLKGRWRSGFMVGSYTEVTEETDEGTYFDSSSDAANQYAYSNKVEDEEAAVQKHFSNQWIMVEDHIPSPEKKKSMKDSHSADDSDYVILKRA